MSVDAALTATLTAASNATSLRVRRVQATSNNHSTTQTPSSTPINTMGYADPAANGRNDHHAIGCVMRLTPTASAAALLQPTPAAVVNATTYSGTSTTSVNASAPRYVETIR